MTEFHQAAAAVYLASGIAALLGIVLPSERIARASLYGLVVGAALQGIAFATLHRAAAPPALTDWVSVGALVAWMAVVVMVFFAWRMRLTTLAAVVGFVAFLFVFASLLKDPSTSVAVAGEAGAWPHAHVLLASAGISLLGVAGLAGIFYLIEHRRLKSKRALKRRVPGPSLEALDRVGVASLAAGFPLLTLGVATGMMWQRSENGVLFAGGPHEVWTLVAWLFYAGVVFVRFRGQQGARQGAATAVAGFVFLTFAVVGVGVLR